MSKSAATFESLPTPAPSPAKRARKSRVKNARSTDSVARAPSGVPASEFPTKPLLVGIGIGAALALGAVALGSRPNKSSYFGSKPETVAGALTKTATLLLARIVARKALAVAANQGVRKLASAWPL